MSTTAPPSPRRWRWLIPAVVVLAVATVAGVAAGQRQSDGPSTWHDQASVARPHVPGPAKASGGSTPCKPADAGAPTQARSARDTDASGWLQLTAATLVTAPADTLTGEFTYVRLYEWASDMTAGADQVGRTTMRVSMSESWFAADGSAATITTTFPDGTASPGPNVPGGRTEREHAPTGAWHNRFPGEPSSDPQTLAGQLDLVQPARVGVQARIRALADIAREYALSCPVRAAALLVLAQSPVIWRGDVTDRAGRTGVAVSIDSTDGVSRETLVLDPVTGVLLTHEETLLRNPGKLAGPFPHLRSSTAYIETGRRSTAPA
ncbi:hypothetical protein Daura_03875 [Dactylosporangium aurantiacum]|uniref:CU044_5270 family protein n=1 Tax=Dactylosporangium aurantiacum TaxID=35754 RepID=A0A9Q9IM07_9ACTN|nr:hypothetical protein [Dactylosporangium aurantiacum]MDG6100503.1 hypothetical protein [Dactylosporangium aurantiacum]UWZ55395.1 hypothetical protein Daura_03875 [Dactylosporangium aurantiacum]